MLRDRFLRMSRKKRILLLAAAAAVMLLAGFLLYIWMFPGKYKVGEDEIALYIDLDTDVDIGLLVFDYTMNGHRYGGGISNADRSMLKHGEEIINVWDRESQHLDDDTQEVAVTMDIRIITEYIDPNYENIYPGEITRRLEEISWDAAFGNAYRITITGNDKDGFRVQFGGLITEP